MKTIIRMIPVILILLGVIMLVGSFFLRNTCEFHNQEQGYTSSPIPAYVETNK